MSRKFCQTCGSFTSNESNKFCIKCGTELIIKQEGYIRKESEQETNSLKEERGKVAVGSVQARNNNFSFLKKILPVVAVVTFVALAGVATYFSQPRTGNEKNIINSNTLNTKNNITNPGYLLSPENFLVDEDNIIKIFPGDWKPVWVEEVMDPTTLKVSYFVVQSGKQVLTFATVRISSLAELGRYVSGECKKEQALKFLKKLVENRYVYLSDGCGDNILHFDGKDNLLADIDNAPDKYKVKKFIIKSVNILNEDLDISRFGTDFAELIAPYAETNDDFTSFAIEKIMYRMGYGIERQEFLSVEPECMYEEAETKLNPGDRQIASIEKRGFWGSCE